MGICQLQYFITNFVPNGVVKNVSIIDECTKFSRDNDGRKPKIIMDLNGLMAIIKADKLKMLYGGSHSKAFNTINDLFRRLSEVADLIFYQDGPTMDQKVNTYISRRNDQYKAFIDLIDQVNSNVPLSQILEDRGRRQLPCTGSGFEFLTILADRYGYRIVAVTRECDAEIAKFACENSSVIAVIADDSDFFIFPGKWRYFSAQNINLEYLTTIEFNRRALRRFLNLNDDQMAILATIAGNDVVTYDEVRKCHGRKIDNIVGYKDPSFVKAKFIRIADIARRLSKKDFQDVLNDLSRFLLGDCSVIKKQRIKDSIEQYQTSFSLDDTAIATPLLKYCRENHFDFIHCVLRGKQLNMVIGFYDRRQTHWPNFYEVLKKLLTKQLGIILQDQQKSGLKQQLEIKAKRSHNEAMEKHRIWPVYPPLTVPTLIEILHRKNYPQLDTIRFKLLKWTISDTLKDIDLTSIPKIYLRHVLTLHFMVVEGFITKFDADIILITIEGAALNKIPEAYEYPPVVDPGAFQIVFLFLDFFIDLERSFEVVGLLDLSTHQTFEGGWFHNIYRKYISSGKNPIEDLGDAKQYRTYKNLPDMQTALSSW